MLKSITKPLPGLTRCCSVCSQRLFPANLEKRKGNRSFHTSLKTDSNKVTKVRNVKDKYESPFKRIEEHLVEPLFKEDNQFFNPTLDDMKHAEKLFKSHRGHSIQHVKAVINPEHLPETKISEVAIIGRSNVGKSSLIKALFNDEQRVDVSRKPGHTKLMHFFQVGKAFTLVDMPGYGTNMPSHYVTSVEAYIQNRTNLARTFLLLDGRTGIVPTDLTAIDMMEEFSKPYAVVFTKIDAVSTHALLKHLIQFRKLRDEKMHGCFPQPFLASSVNSSGLPILQSFIAYVTGQLAVKGF